MDLALGTILIFHDTYAIIKRCRNIPFLPEPKEKDVDILVLALLAVTGGITAWQGIYRQQLESQPPSALTVIGMALGLGCGVILTGRLVLHPIMLTDVLSLAVVSLAGTVAIGFIPYWAASCAKKHQTDACS